MIDRSSRLFREHPNILQESTEHGMPVMASEKPGGLPKEKSTQINMLLKGLAKERMIGSILEEARSSKYSNGERKAHTSMANYVKDASRSPSCRKDHGLTRPVPSTFLSSFDLHSPTKRKESGCLSPLRPRLPTISRQGKPKPKEVSKSVWEKISCDNRLKREMLHSYISARLCSKVADTFIRFLEPPFESAPFRFNEFLNGLLKLPDICRGFLEFQLLDVDNDGVITSRDILDMYMDITLEGKEPSAQFKAQLDSLSHSLQQYLGAEEKPSEVRSLFETVVCDRTTTLSRINVLVDRELKLDSPLKNFVHHSAYTHTFLVFGHNQKMRARSHLLDKARHRLDDINFRSDKGLTLGIYLQIPTEFYGSLINLFLEEDGAGRGDAASLELVDT